MADGLSVVRAVEYGRSFFSIPLRRPVCGVVVLQRVYAEAKVRCNMC